MCDITCDKWNVIDFGTLAFCVLLTSRVHSSKKGQRKHSPQEHNEALTLCITWLPHSATHLLSLLSSALRWLGLPAHLLTCISFPNQPLGIHSRLLLNFHALSFVLQNWKEPVFCFYHVSDYWTLDSCPPSFERNPSCVGLLPSGFDSPPATLSRKFSYLVFSIRIQKCNDDTTPDYIIKHSLWFPKLHTK